MYYLHLLLQKIFTYLHIQVWVCFIHTVWKSDVMCYYHVATNLPTL